MAIDASSPERRQVPREEPALYADPTPYDILHTPGTAQEVDLLQRLARRHGARSGTGARWLEPACGSGRYLRVLAGRGLRATGVDRDRGMLEYARRALDRRGRLGRVALVEADMAEIGGVLAPASHDLAFNLVNSIRHLDSDAAMLRHLRGVHRALRPGGLYIVGISLSHYGEEVEDEDSWQARRGSCEVRQLVTYLPPAGRGARERFETVVSHLAIRRPSGTTHQDSRYRLRCYDEGQWKGLLARSPFQRAASVTDRGEDVAGRALNYQLEVLRAP